MPIAIFFHGFTGIRQEKRFIFAKASRMLEKSGVASLRFDFSGSGDSDGDFRDMTFLSEVSDASAILEFAKTLEFVDLTKIYLIGMSMGGAVASVLAGRRPDEIARICLWSSAGDLYNVLRSCVTAGAGRFEFNTDDTIDVLGSSVGKALFDEIEHMDIFKEASGFLGPVLILHGDNDEIVPLENAFRYRETYKGSAELQVIQGANHTFDNLKWEAEVLTKTTAFLKKN